MLRVKSSICVLLLTLSACGENEPPQTPSTKKESFAPIPPAAPAPVPGAPSTVVSDPKAKPNKEDNKENKEAREQKEQKEQKEEKETGKEPGLKKVQGTTDTKSESRKNVTPEGDEGKNGLSSGLGVNSVAPGAGEPSKESPAAQKKGTGAQTKEAVAVDMPGPNTRVPISDQTLDALPDRKTDALNMPDQGPSTGGPANDEKTLIAARNKSEVQFEEAFKAFHKIDRVKSAVPQDDNALNNHRDFLAETGVQYSAAKAKLEAGAKAALEGELNLLKFKLEAFKTPNAGQSEGETPNALVDQLQISYQKNLDYLIRKEQALNQYIAANVRSMKAASEHSLVAAEAFLAMDKYSFEVRKWNARRFGMVWNSAPSEEDLSRAKSLAGNAETMANTLYPLGKLKREDLFVFEQYSKITRFTRAEFEGIISPIKKAQIISNYVVPDEPEKKLSYIDVKNLISQLVRSYNAPNSEFRSVFASIKESLSRNPASFSRGDKVPISKENSDLLIRLDAVLLQLQAPSKLKTFDSILTALTTHEALLAGVGTPQNFREQLDLVIRNVAKLYCFEDDLRYWASSLTKGVRSSEPDGLSKLVDYLSKGISSTELEIDSLKKALDDAVSSL